MPGRGHGERPRGGDDLRERLRPEEDVDPLELERLAVRPLQLLRPRELRGFRGGRGARRGERPGERAGTSRRRGRAAAEVALAEAARSEIERPARRREPRQQAPQRVHRAQRRTGPARPGARRTGAWAPRPEARPRATVRDVLRGPRRCRAEVVPCRDPSWSPSPVGAAGRFRRRTPKFAETNAEPKAPARSRRAPRTHRPSAGARGPSRAARSARRGSRPAPSPRSRRGRRSRARRRARGRERRRAAAPSPGRRRRWRRRWRWARGGGGGGGGGATICQVKSARATCRRASAKTVKRWSPRASPAYVRLPLVPVPHATLPFRCRASR